MYNRAADRAVIAHVRHGMRTGFAKSCVTAGYQHETLCGCCQTNFTTVTTPWLWRCVICRWCDRRGGGRAAVVGAYSVCSSSSELSPSGLGCSDSVCPPTAWLTAGCKIRYQIWRDMR